MSQTESRLYPIQAWNPDALGCSDEMLAKFADSNPKEAFAEFPEETVATVCRVLTSVYHDRNIDRVEIVDAKLGYIHTQNGCIVFEIISGEKVLDKHEVQKIAKLWDDELLLVSQVSLNDPAMDFVNRQESVEYVAVTHGAEFSDRP